MVTGGPLTQNQRELAQLSLNTPRHSTIWRVAVQKIPKTTCDWPLSSLEAVKTDVPCTEGLRPFENPKPSARYQKRTKRQEYRLSRPALGRAKGGGPNRGPVFLFLAHCMSVNISQLVTGWG